MRKETFILALILVMQGIFEILPNYPETAVYYDFFLFSDVKLTWQTWFHYLMGHVVLLLLSYLLIEKTRYARLFLWLQVAYMVDYLLGFNENWYGYLEIHAVSVLIFVIAILKGNGWRIRNGGIIRDGLFTDTEDQEGERSQATTRVKNRN